MKKTLPEIVPDSALWYKVAETVKPLQPEKKRVKKETGSSPASPAGGIAPKVPLSSSSLKTTKGDVISATPPVGMDRATGTKLKKGRLPIEGRLDLHGLTQEKSFQALQQFIARSAARGLRTLLVITGKGARGQGILRQKLPLWLAEPELCHYILAISPAQLRDGGEGAFYIRLRKPREK